MIFLAQTVTSGGGVSEAVPLWTIALVIVQMIFNLLVGFGMWALSRKAARLDRLEQRAEERAEALVESKLAGLAVRLEGVIGIANERIETIRERLKKGDDNFAGLDERDRDLERRWQVQYQALKDYLHQNFATKQSVLAVHQRIDQLQHAGNK